MEVQTHPFSMEYFARKQTREGVAVHTMSVRKQIRPVLTLALPLILAELGWMSMGIVDTIMVGHMANPALAISSAASLSSEPPPAARSS